LHADSKALTVASVPLFAARKIVDAVSATLNACNEILAAYQATPDA
jgi:hypothetical protein